MRSGKGGDMSRIIERSVQKKEYGKQARKEGFSDKMQVQKHIEWEISKVNERD